MITVKDLKEHIFNQSIPDHAVIRVQDEDGSMIPADLLEDSQMRDSKGDYVLTLNITYED